MVAERDSLDWKDLEAPEIVKRVTEKVQPGSIVLFHNAALHTPEALPTILETLIQDGYTFVPKSCLPASTPLTTPDGSARRKSGKLGRKPALFRCATAGCGDFQVRLMDFFPFFVYSYR